MAKNKNTDKPSEKASLTSLIQFPLLPTEEPAVVAVIADVSQVLSDKEYLIRNGWAFLTEWNPVRQNFGCLVKCQDSSSEDAGVGFYSNAPTAFAAEAIAVYKLFLPRTTSISELVSLRGTGGQFS